MLLFITVLLSIQKILFLELIPLIPLIQLADFDSNRLSKLFISNKNKLLFITIQVSIQEIGFLS